ncbi:MAG: class I SAM-dependent methyltransferase [Pseudomonadota bacterium]
MTDAAFWDRVAPKYANQPISNVDAYETTLARVKTYLGAETNALELGCGTGSTALRLHEGTARYAAADISPGMIDIAQAKIAEATEQAPTFHVAGVDEKAFANGPFNTVLAFNLLHLVPDLDAALKTIHRHLPVGGLFISKTPAIGAKWYYRPLIGALQLIGKAPHVSFLTVPEVDDRIEAAGFQIVETGLYPPSVPSRFVVARKR